MNRVILIIALGFVFTLTKAQTVGKDTIMLNAIDIKAQQYHRTEQALHFLTPLSDIPVSTSTVANSVIEEKNIQNVNEALKYATGIRPTLNYGGFQTFYMRGFGKPVIMVDGARDERMNLSSSAPVPGLSSIDHIEYLKGPASVLYGHSAVGGILNFVRKSPTEKPTFNAMLSTGSWNTNRAVLGAGGSASKYLNYRIDVELMKRDGWRDNNDERANYYGAFDIKISEKDILTIRASVTDDFYGTETGIPSVKWDIFDKSGNKVLNKGELPDAMEIDQRYNDTQDFFNHQSYNISADYTHKFNENLSFRNKFDFVDDDIDYFSTEQLSYVINSESIYDHYYTSNDERKYIDLNTLQRTFPLRFSHKTKTYQNHAEINWRFNTGSIRHNFVGGYSFLLLDRTTYKGYNVYNENPDVYGSGVLASISVVDPTLYQGQVDTKFSKATIIQDATHGIFAHNLIEVNDKLKVMLGVRADVFQYENQSADVSEGTSVYNKKETEGLENVSFSYRGGIVYKPIKNISFYGSVSSFFKPIRIVYNKNYIYINKEGKEYTPDAGGVIFEPENGYQGEIGSKISLNSNITFTFCAYYINKQNIRERLSKNVYGQVGEVESKGFEIEGYASPVKGSSINFGYTFNQAQYLKFKDNSYSEGSREGNTLRHAPENRLFIWYSHTFQQGFLKNLQLGAGFDYTSQVFTDSDNNYSLPEYTLFDTSISYKISNTTIRFNLNNIFDKEYFVNSVYSNQYIPGAERNFIFSINYRL